MLITNITVNGDQKNFQYKLERIEQEWSEKFDTAPEDDKQRYDFTRFFLNTFFQNVSDTGEIFVKDRDSLSEDKTKIVFKRDILL